MVDTERFVDDDGNIRWGALLSIGSATVFLGWVTGFIDFIAALGAGLRTSLFDLGGFFESIVTAITGMPPSIVRSGLATIGEWLEMLGPLAFPAAVIIWGTLGLGFVWALSLAYDRWRGDGG